MTKDNQYERDTAIPGSIPSSVRKAGERVGVTNRTEDADEYSLLGITSLSYGPSYMIEITDGPDADEQVEYADTIYIGGVYVGLSDAEIECKEWRVVDGEGSRRTLVIDPIEDHAPR